MSDVPVKAQRCKFCCAAIEPLPAAQATSSKAQLLTGPWQQGSHGWAHGC